MSSWRCSTRWRWRAMCRRRWRWRSVMSVLRPVRAVGLPQPVGGGCPVRSGGRSWLASPRILDREGTAARSGQLQVGAIDVRAVWRHSGFAAGREIGRRRRIGAVVEGLSSSRLGQRSHRTRDPLGARHELSPGRRRGARVLHLNRALVASPSSQPRIAVNSTSHTSEMCECPKTQLTFTCAVLETASAIR